MTDEPKYDEEELFELMMVLTNINGDIASILTLLELSRLRGDTQKYVPIVKRKLLEIGKKLDGRCK